MRDGLILELADNGCCKIPDDIFLEKGGVLGVHGSACHRRLIRWILSIMDHFLT